VFALFILVLLLNMAGASAKKTAKNASDKTLLYSLIAISGSLLNMVVRITLFTHGTSLLSVTQMVFLALMSLLSFAMIKSSLQLGVGYSLWQDLFIVNTAVQITSLLSDWFWLLYSAVPGYALYMMGQKIKEFVFAPRVDEVTKEPRRKKLR